ncbi:hypothetical protein AXG93_4584s1000 [Marchantia polymorpha subsp. ruderalis]|uniref:Uncharacterized protein n=1 Tax=Marchantia polymorpha subsp. ruderalis TaxID=1480154 RepID=A0A176W1H3_MARPO|nr:hypothetical protein AXG93_4584s1000 [Marchantia polymorpha subsp. ruderalis]
MVTAEVSDSSVEKTVAPIVNTSEFATSEKVTVDLMARLEKSREAYDAAIKRSERLITTAEKREKMHIEELAKVEARRAEEVRIAKELWSKIVEAKTAEEDLCSKISKIEVKCEMKF